MENPKPNIDQPHLDDLQGRFENKIVGGGPGQGRIELYDNKSEKEKKDCELKEAWEAKRKELSALWVQIRKLSEDPDFARKVRKEREEFNYFITSGCKERGDTLQDYMAFHHVAGGSTNFDYSPMLDFPGKYSVEKFYRRCIDGDFPLQEGRKVDE